MTNMLGILKATTKMAKPKQRDNILMGKKLVYGNNTMKMVKTNLKVNLLMMVLKLEHGKIGMKMEKKLNLHINKLHF